MNANTEQVETQIAGDIARRSVVFIPLAIAFGAAVGGQDGAVSALFGLVLAVANFLVSAWLLSNSAKISLNLLMMVALVGYVVRLAVIFAIVATVNRAAWVDMWALGVSLVVAHLGLLLWEMRYIAASLTFPGLRPSSKGSVA